MDLKLEEVAAKDKYQKVVHNHNEKSIRKLGALE